MRKKNKKEKGITLIALVVTIVVLLILATVSIQMLGGENGIIKQAIESKDKTKEEGAKEQIGVEVQGSYGIDGKIDIPLLNENLGHIEGITYKGASLSDTNKIASLPATVELEGVKVVINGDGSTAESVAGKRYEDETDIKVGGTPVTVPGKFTVSGLEEESTIEDGLVIYLVPDGTTVNWNDSTEVEYAQKNYDQFVWVPVPNAIAKDKNSDGTIDETDIDLMIADEEYPMAIATDETNYRGILYDFTLTEGKVTVSDKNWSATSTSYREPAYLTNSNYADGSSYNTVGITESSLQSEFNAMVNKVSSKKGFWVGRYETSNMSSSNANDSSKQIKVIKGTTAGINNVNWYRMYAQQKSYSKLALGSGTVATSSMIWGSQWEQIMIWMKGVRNTNKNSYYVINALGMGNYGTSDDSDTNTSAPAPTGNSENYKVKNVYDLAGNVWDWSLEADTTSLRVLRGGYYNVTDSSSTRAVSRNYYYPYSSYTHNGSRASLY